MIWKRPFYSFNRTSMRSRQCADKMRKKFLTVSDMAWIRRKKSCKNFLTDKSSKKWSEVRMRYYVTSIPYLSACMPTWYKHMLILLHLIYSLWRSRCCQRCTFSFHLKSTAKYQLPYFLPFQSLFSSISFRESHRDITKSHIE